MSLFLRILKFLAGFTSNLAIQTLKAATNAFLCLSLSAGSMACLVLAALQTLGGGGKVARESSSASWNMAKAASKRGAFSMLQTAGVLTLLSPLARAAQACSEEIKPNGIFDPAGKGRNIWQRVFGFNSWEEPLGKTVEMKRVAECELPKTMAAPATPPICMEKIEQIKVAPKRKCQKIQKSTDENWIRLVGEYLAAQTQDQMDSARVKMATRHPRRYSKALAEALVRTRKSIAA